MNKLLKAYLFMFIFTTFNREFRLFGFDPRYLVVAMAAALLVGWLLNRGRELRDDVRQCEGKFSFLDIAILYGISTISNLSWFWNGLPLNQEQFTNLVILNASNALFATVLVLFRDKLNVNDILRYSLISLLIMALSMLWVYIGMELPGVFHDNEIRVLNTGESFVNLFGQEVRIAGFAEDANYASLFSAIGFALCFTYFKPWSLIQIAAGAVFALAFALSFSKTVAIGIVMAILVLVIRWIVFKSWKSCSWILSASIALLGIFLMLRIPLFQSLSTTSTRFKLWSIAQTVLSDNPILGGGLSSVRSAINVAYNGLWYVQCHSTFWQVLAEHGPFALVVLVVIIARRYAISRTWWQVFILTLFAALCLTSELMYQQVFVYVLVLMPLLSLSDKPVTKGEKELTRTQGTERIKSRVRYTS